MKLGLYKHYKGNVYRVIGVARHSETLQELVVYQALYGNYGLWIRPAEMFQELITYNGQTVHRFTFIELLFERAPEITR